MAADLYKALGVGKEASADEIRTAYRRLAKEYHPDHYGCDSRPFLKIQEAYAILSDPDKRRAYDRSCQPAIARSPRRQRGDLFRDVTHETFPGSGKNRTRPAPFSDPGRFGHEPYGSIEDLFDTLWQSMAGSARKPAARRRWTRGRQ